VASYLVVFLVTALGAFVATPLVRRIAVRIGAIDRPSDRKVHPKPTPTLGGLAMWIACLAGLAAAYLLPAFDDVFVSSEPLGVILAGTVIVGLGSYDDLKGIAVPAKIAGQILAAGLLILTGVQLLYFWLPWTGVLSLGQDLAVPFTVIWVVAMINAVNLIDGLDGLAAGVVAIAAAAFFAYVFSSPGIIEGPSPAGLFSVVVAGAALGFLPHNFNPAKIFMGDSGSMLLGLILAAATISGVGRTGESPTNADLAALAIPVAIPLLVLAVPFTDVVWAIARRLRRRRPVYRPDKEHIHHRLLDIGHSHRQAVLLMYLWSALLAAAALAITFIRSRGVVLMAIFVIAVALVGTAAPRMRRANGRVRAS
jgi:UDP-GlcNAc:undecaprenyl-phosphate GlcNAc-1-phosphate transferase